MFTQNVKQQQEQTPVIIKYHLLLVISSCVACSFFFFFFFFLCFFEDELFDMLLSTVSCPLTILLLWTVMASVLAGSSALKMKSAGSFWSRRLSFTIKSCDTAASANFSSSELSLLLLEIVFFLFLCGILISSSACMNFVDPDNSLIPVIKVIWKFSSLLNLQRLSL